MNFRFGRIAIFAVATLAMLLVIVLRWGEVKQMADVVRHADWKWLPFALITESLFQCNESAIYWLMYRIMGYHPALLRVIGNSLAASFVNRVAPSGGVSGTAFFTEQMSKEGVPAAETVTVYISRFMLDYGAFVLILAGGLFYLSTHHELTRVEIKSAIIFAIMLLVVTCAVAVVITRQDILNRFLRKTASIINRVSQRLASRDMLPESKISHLMTDIYTAMGVLGKSGMDTFGLILMGFLIHVFDLSTLFIVFQAVGYPVHLGVLIAGFGLAYLAGIVSLMPSGIGAFEASMAIVYASLGVPLETAILVTILYRVFSLWLPLLAGFISFHLVVGERWTSP